jgi:oxygen-independent coproporphyrinogen-3 oxidase
VTAVVTKPKDGSLHLSPEVSFDERLRGVNESKAAVAKMLAPFEAQDPAGEADLEAVLDCEPETADRVIYVHTPYCDKLCCFCDFVRGVPRAEELPGYIDQLCRELADYGDRAYLRAKPFQAVYFGGGTPTIYSVEQLDRILRSLRRHMPLAEDCEITFETTLHNLSDEKIRLLNSLGVNRLSLGAQTFSDRGRRLLTRTGTGAQALERTSRARELFQGTVSVDLIYGYPGQTEQELLADADTAVGLDPDSISFYSLRLHPASELAKMIARGKVSFRVDLHHELDFQNIFLETVRRSGYEILDLLKVSRDNRDEHRYYRLKYRVADVLPVGDGAGGTVGGIDLYRLAPGFAMYRRLGPLLRRYLKILALMQHPQVDLAQVEGLSSPHAVSNMSRMMPALEASGLLAGDGGRAYRLTDAGIFWGNNVAVMLLESLVEGELGRPAQATAGLERTMAP